MIESLQLIQQKIEFVIDRMSCNNPLRDELIIANIECDELITNEKIDISRNRYDY